jgi:hypothetical protein
LENAKNIQLPIINLNGSRHSLFYINGIIKIGCEKHVISKWMSDYKEIGKDNNYSEDEISEYYEYIKMISDLISKEN